MYRLFVLSSVLVIFGCHVIIVASDYEDPTRSDDDVEKCQNKNYVCRTLMRVSRDDNGKFEPNDEQDNCRCDSCLSGWDESDGFSITWTSYERRDQKFQYKFCSNISTARECANDSAAIELITDVKQWNPRMDAVFCRCPRDEYWLDGWRREGAVWTYVYSCHKPTCERRDPCVKHYFDYDGKTTAFEFQCSCQEGFHCPSNQQLSDSTFTDVDSDEKFVYGYCRRNNNRMYS